MEYGDSFRRIKLLNNNPKNFHHSSSMNSISINRYSKSNSRQENNNVKIRKKKDKILSTSSLGLIKSQNKNKNYNQTKELKCISNNYRYKNTNYLLQNYNQNIVLNPNKKNNSDLSTSQNNKQNIYPDIYLNKNRNVSQDNINIDTHNSKRKLCRNKSINNLKRETTTFYSLSKNPYTNFLLDKRIRILNEPQSNTYNSKFLEENNIPNESGIKYSNKRIFYNKLLPNDLKIYKEKLFNESNNKNISKSKSQENIPPINNINSDQYLNKNIKKSDSKKSIDEEKNFENIEFNGVVTKVITKLPIEKDLNEKNNEDNLNNIDYHKIMKHPFVIETYGYDFLRNLKNEYKIYENPFEDKNLIYNIHNLIINPNTKKFRNDNLIIGADFYRRKNKGEVIKDYKLLSKQGYQKMQNSIMRNLKRDVEKSISHMHRIKFKLDILMENNIKKFKEHREELINEEL